MRNILVASLLLAPLALAGCGSSGTSGSAASSSAASSAAGGPAATAVTGSVTMADSTIAIQPTAKLELSIVDMTKQPGVTVNKQDFAPPKFPQAFSIPFTNAQINPTDLYVLQATLQNGDRTYTTKLQQPVITNGTPTQVSLSLVAEPTKAERIIEAFNQAQRATGGMTAKNGTSSKIGQSESWQVFSDLRGVQFIIVQVDHGSAGGFTKTEYAYRNSLPWMIVQTQAASSTAKPTSTTRISWNDTGVVELNQQVSGSQTTTLSAAQGKALHAQAEAEYKKFAKH